MRKPNAGVECGAMVHDGGEEKSTLSDDAFELGLALCRWPCLQL